MEKIEKNKSLKTSNTEEARDKRRSMGLAKDNIERIQQKINKCNSLLSRDLEKKNQGTGYMKRFY
jgi:hypothetical protein